MPPQPSAPNRGPILLALAAGLALLLVATLRWSSHPTSQTSLTSLTGQTSPPVTPAPRPGDTPSFARAGSRSPESIVADRLAVFVRKRREAAQRLAERDHVAVPADVLAFFAAAEAGDWQRTQSLYEALHARRHANEDTRPKELESVWPAVHETLGVAEVANTWPAKSLIEYADAILGTLRPGMVYLGGTDAGRFVPSLFNDVGGADDRVILTQNALADRTYLDYVNLLHGTRIEALSNEDSDRAFQTYLTDAQRRAQHDAATPDGPRQVRPGETIDLSPDGRVQVSGQVAVMAINESLLQTLLAKNPDLHFALEESFPMKSLYADSLPAGPIMELRAGGTDPESVRQRAEASLALWTSTAERLPADTSLPDDSPVRRAWSDMAVAQASYFAEHQLAANAEQAWKAALAIAPGSENALFPYVGYLVDHQRSAEARLVVDAYLRRNPNPPAGVVDLQRVLKTLPSPTHP